VIENKRVPVGADFKNVFAGVRVWTFVENANDFIDNFAAALPAANCCVSMAQFGASKELSRYLFGARTRYPNDAKAASTRWRGQCNDRLF
jgi:hypothetical protein